MSVPDADLQAAYDEKDYAAVVDAVSGLDLSSLGDKYADLKPIFEEAAYNYAEALYADKRPYEAYQIYKMIPDYKDVADKKMTRICYQVIGSWVSSKGAHFIFNDDGTCSFDGANMYYYARQYLLQTGPTADDMSTDYQIINISKRALTLKNKKSGKTYRLTREETEQAE